jgi:hypothetical protein
MLTQEELDHLKSAACSDCRDIALREEKAQKVKVTYLGWPGHYCASRYCVFHLNTLIEYGEKRFVVSTVGNQWEQKGDMFRTIPIGCSHYYETMAFPAVLRDRYWEAETSSSIKLSGVATTNAHDYHSDIKAQAMHEAIVQEIIGRLLQGEDINP